MEGHHNHSPPFHRRSKLQGLKADLKNSSVGLFRNFKYLVVHRTRSVKDGVFQLQIRQIQLRQLEQATSLALANTQCHMPTLGVIRDYRNCITYPELLKIQGISSLPSFFLYFQQFRTQRKKEYRNSLLDNVRISKSMCHSSASD